MKEAIKTATKAGLFTVVSNQIANSTVLRRIPGMASVREGMELKKRELYERTGRDESGRKLTKRELEDRELRRRDAGAVASIWELLDQDWRNGVPVVIKGIESAAFAMMSGFGSNMAGGERFRPISREYGRSDNVTIASSGEGAYDIQDESSAALARREEQQEQERQDDADQDRDQEQEEGFFTKLFSRTFGSRDRSRSGGLIDSLLGIVGPLLGIFGGGGGIIGMLSGIVAPLMGVLATAGTAIIGFITPLLPVIIGGILVGAAGLLITKWIEGFFEDKGKETQTGIGRAYTVTAKDGTKRAATAQELGTTDEEIASGFRMTAQGDVINPNAYFASTEGGKVKNPTNPRLSAPYRETRSEAEIFKSMQAYREVTGETLGVETYNRLGEFVNAVAQNQAERDEEGGLSRGEGLAAEKERKPFIQKLRSLDILMGQFSKELNETGNNIDSTARRERFMRNWNYIRDQADKLIEESSKKGFHRAVAKALYYISRQYTPFLGLMKEFRNANGVVTDYGVTPGSAVISSGIFSDSVIVPGEDSLTGVQQTMSLDGLKTPMPTQIPSTTLDMLNVPGRSSEIISTENEMGTGSINAKPNGSGNFVTTLSAALNQARNGMMGGGGGQAPVIINNNSPTSNVMAPMMARQPTGIDMAQMFNGARLATI